MIRRPPRSTLFPYRRSSDLPGAGKGVVGNADCLVGAGDFRDGLRSEEHTSELQSHSDLVCRLLLEKKKRDRWRTVITAVRVAPGRNVAYYEIWADVRAQEEE